MKSVTMSLKVFGIYLILIPGIGLMIVPELILDLFSLRHGDENWLPRMVGLLAFIIGCFEISIAKNQISKLYNLTVYLRYFAALFMVGLWLTGEVEISILAFAAIDAAGATWTMLTIKNADTTP
ncbi:MAG: hypothetical protein RIR48_2752 [Bacteroidota bacterium]